MSSKRERYWDKASCLYRDHDVKVIGWTDARIPWPLCRAFGVRGGGHGLLVDEELARAIRQESAAAVAHWWGVNLGTVCRWRLALGVDRVNNPGSHRLILASAQKGAEQVRGVPLSPSQREQRRRSAIENNLAQYFRPGYHGPRWTEAELALLGTMLDDEVAARTGRTELGVRLKRQKLGIPRYRPAGGPDHFWSQEEVALLGTVPDKEIAWRIGRTWFAVYTKRRELGIPNRFDGRRRDGQR